MHKRAPIDIPELTESEVAAIRAMTNFEFYLFQRNTDRATFAQNAETNRIAARALYRAGFPMLARAVGRSMWRDYMEWGGLGMGRDNLIGIARLMSDIDPDLMRSMEAVAGLMSDRCKRYCEFKRHYIV